MRTVRSAASAAVAAALGCVGLTALALPATAAPTSCQGQPVTVTGIVGTEGDDVMAVEPGQYTTVQGLGGDDLICLVATPMDEWRNVGVDAGPGDDTVVNESTDVSSVMYRITLGEGADTYRGLVVPVPQEQQSSPVIEEVHAGAEASGTQDLSPDVIDTGGGDDIVHSGTTTPGAANLDVVRTGPGADTVHWAGERAGSTLDLGAGANAMQLYPGWQATSVVVDARRRLATGDGRPVLQWTGDLSDVTLELDNRDVTYVGTDADESLVMGPTSGAGSTAPANASRSAQLGGGDDVLVLAFTGSGTVDGGSGRDRFYSGTCSTVRARLGGTFTCGVGADVSHTFDFARWEDLLVKGRDVSVRGSDRAEKIKAVGVRIRLQGLGGADVLNPNVALGWQSIDTPVIVSGGRGDDRILGSYAADRLRGGPGDDKLFGQLGDDSLLGGTGRDKAVGRTGQDRCSAEVRRTCESR